MNQRSPSDTENVSITEKIVAFALRGALPVLIFVGALAAGLLALQLTPREEEPQIVVPMVDVLVQAPGLSAQQMERQITTPLEKLLAQIPGVEHIYSSSSTAQASVTLRFYVGEDREKSILNTYNKLYSNQDKMPGQVSQWLVNPIEVDDVPILLLGLYSQDPSRYSDFELRRMADEISIQLQAIDNTSVVSVHGGRARTISIELKPESMAARKTTASDLIHALQSSNVLQSAGRWSLGNQSFILESGDVLRNLDELKHTVVNVVDGIPVYLLEVADIKDGPSEAKSYQWISFVNHVADASRLDRNKPMVSISVAKQAGSNAVQVAAN